MMNGMLLFELISAESSGLLGLTPRVAERGRPDGHLVLLLLSKLARHVVGEQQRRDADHQTEHDDQHAVAEREEGICESFFHGRGLFALGVLLREYPAVAGRVGEQLDGGRTSRSRRAEWRATPA